MMTATRVRLNMNSTAEQQSDTSTGPPTSIRASAGGERELIDAAQAERELIDAAQAGLAV